MENCQIGVFLAYASVHGHALLTAPSIYHKYGQTTVRVARTLVPAEQRFATKPQLARHMLQRPEAGVPATWVTGDSVYGDDRRLRVWLEEQDHAYVLAVSEKNLSGGRVGGAKSKASWRRWGRRAGRLSAGAGPRAALV